MTARDLLQHTYDVLTSFMLDSVDDGESWEDSYPELDELRAEIGDILAKPLNLTEGVES